MPVKKHSPGGTKAASAKLKSSTRTSVCATERASSEIAESLYDILSHNGDILVKHDQMYNFVIVYVYCDCETMRRIYGALYGDQDVGENAMALTTLGRYVRNKYVPVVTVWINSVQEKGESVPSMAHEISHAADMILEHARVEDRNGEARAYLVEREFRDILPALYGIDVGTMVDMDAIVGDIGAIRAIVDKTSEDPEDRNEDECKAGDGFVKKGECNGRQQNPV